MSNLIASDLSQNHNGLIGLHNSPPFITISTADIATATTYFPLCSAYLPWKIRIQSLHSWSPRPPKYNNFRKHLPS
ncbi:hypothetical protein L6452_42940 [Arctium lappa]|uniref:Uncharacterized protein n=1 Tax=Arctium lappa TaxID=4217 RepID=A0ACB8XK08_ARCLA|nr:hypothetical protein L6452_42940 [Arctium lappa]